MLRDNDEEERKRKAERKIANMLRQQEEQEAKLKMEPAQDEPTSKRRDAQNEEGVQQNTEEETCRHVAAVATGNNKEKPSALPLPSAPRLRNSKQSRTRELHFKKMRGLFALLLMLQHSSLLNRRRAHTHTLPCG